MTARKLPKARMIEIKAIIPTRLRSQSGQEVLKLATTNIMNDIAYHLNALLESFSTCIDRIAEERFENN